MVKLMKKILLALLIAALGFSSLAISAGAAAGGSGVAVIATETNLIKTGLLGQKLVFSDTDFKSAMGVSDFYSITVESLPDAKSGVLMLGGRKVTEGQQIRRRNIASLTFVPSSREVTESRFTFTMANTAAGAEIECIMKFIERVNYQPKIDTDASKTLSVTTQKGISVYGNMEASDPDGDDIEFIIVSYPKYGILKTDEGEFTYTPSGEYTGKDSFVYVARDEYGNYSKPARVTVNVTARMSEVVYEDMKESRYYNSAVALTAMGIMSGERVGDGMYFNPEATVTRAEFVAMAMKALGIKADSTLKKTFFDDNGDIPSALVSYVATAQRCGAVNGAFDGKGLYFRPNDAITTYEAAIVMANLLGADEAESQASVSGIESIPVWARSDVSVMYELGIFSKNDALVVTDHITREFVSECLFKLSEL
jgi:hypothetical protein